MAEKIYKTWVYHATEEPKIIDSDEFESYKKEGWADTPAAFVNIEEAGIDVDNPEQVQQFGEAIDGVKDSLNGALNLELMTKKELEAYAREHYGQELDRRKTKAKLVEQVKEMIHGETIQ